MAIIKLIREDVNKTVCETLNLNHGTLCGVGVDRIIVSGSAGNNAYGYRITQEDFDYLYEKKRREAEAELEKRKTEEEREQERKIEEIKKWELEQKKRDKKFPRCIFKKFLI